MIAWTLPHGPDAPVAFGGAGSRFAADLVRDAAAIATGLPPPTPGSHVLLVLEQDRYTLAAAMLGAWLAGHAIAFPPHGRRAGVAFVLTRPEIVALVHDTRAGGHLQVEALLARPVLDPAPGLTWPSGTAVTWFRLTPDGQGVEPYAQTAAQVRAEGHALLDRLPALREARITAEAEPFAPAAILLGILLPLMSGGAFERRPSGATGDVLVTTPAGSLGRARPWSFVVATCDAGDDPRLAAEFPHETAALWLCAATGSLATRRAGSAWQPLMGVEAAQGPEGLLQAHVPWGLQPLVCCPRKVTMTAPGGFEVVGRSEDPPGVPSCATLERVALTHAGVQDVVVTQRAHPDGVEVFVWLAGTADATRVRDRLEVELAEASVPTRLHLAEDAQLPREPEGGVPRWRVLRRFGRAPDGQLQAAELHIEPVRIEPADVRPGEAHDLAITHVDVPADYRWFVGHFDGYPILAGVLQLHELVVPVAQRAWPQLGAVRELQKLKFLGRIVPGDRLRLTLRLDPRTLACDFSLDKSEQPCSAGRLCFARNAP